MSGYWKKLNTDELDQVKGAGSPCDQGLQGHITKMLGLNKFSKGSCQPAYEINQMMKGANKSQSSSCTTSGAGCTARTTC